MRGPIYLVYGPEYDYNKYRYTYTYYMYIGKHVCEGVVRYFGVKIEYAEILKVFIIVYIDHK